jgi:hypothetical protein
MWRQSTIERNHGGGFLMRVAFFPLLLLGCLAFEAQTVDEISITSPAWPGPEPGSPALPATGFGLWFRLAPARSRESRTLALLGSARLPGRFADIYGGRVAGAIEIVAINSATGRVYHATAEESGPPPLASAMDADPAPPRKGIARTQQMEVWFNADLRSHLGLPPESAAYFVFLWLDDITSQPARAMMPGTNSGNTARSPRFEEPAGVQWTTARNTARGAAIALSSVAGGRIRGEVSPAILKSAGFLNLFVLDYRTRAFAARTIAAPQSFGGAFEIDIDSLAGHGPAAGKRFVIATAGGIVSNVVTLDAPAHAG